jgi:hypothetical protein
MVEDRLDDMSLGDAGLGHVRGRAAAHVMQHPSPHWLGTGRLARGREPLVEGGFAGGEVAKAIRRRAEYEREGRSRRTPIMRPMASASFSTFA